MTTNITDSTDSSDRTALAPGAPEEYWRRVLATGGASVLPTWVEAPRGAGPASEHPHLAEHLAPWPHALADQWTARLRDLTEELGVGADAVAHAAHAVVLAALTGESAVVLGVVAAGGHVVPLQVDAGAPTWRRLVAEVHEALVEARRHGAGGDLLDALTRETGLSVPVRQTAVVVASDAPDVGDQVRLSVSIDNGGVRLRYRTDALDPSAAARVAGYHQRAVEALFADADAPPPRPGRLLSEAEVQHQLVGLAGPGRTLRAQPVHRLIEEQVRRHPDAVAVRHGDDTLTYAELNARANRVARTLVADGVAAEDVVAVVTERDLAWIIAVLAVLKAGATYLPIEPHFPTARIATTLRRAGATHALTEPTAAANLDQALATLSDEGRRVVRVTVEDALAEVPDGADRDLDVEVAPDQRAYIYFTSGSTGEPKGAMCEHAGMLNHVLAKIEDLQIGASDVVAQVAPQCFDISLWQLVAALVVGGETLIVEQDVILDAEQMVDRLQQARVGVLQVVPSYLEVLMTYLERRPRPLPDLHVVSVTGEAVKKELVERWFALVPRLGARIAIVNAYGLTETSDDTNHEVMHEPPVGDRVPLGPPIRNARVYVVDEALDPVPLGAPGEIVFSGVCVGRGYVNDPERTALAFGADPHRPGQRLYRSGDVGRWRSDGKLDFLGRHDTQLKIAGFRIEIGEIENTLLRAPGVRDAAVVVVEHANGSRHLVGFSGGERPPPGTVLRQHLADSLPHYMVPRTMHWRETLPLSDNGKIDRSRLTALAHELDVGADASTDVDNGGGGGRWTPTSEAERRVADAWARALERPVERFGPDDHFFDLGGNSLAAVKVVIALERAVDLRTVTDHPRLADLARVLAARDPTPDRPSL